MRNAKEITESLEIAKGLCEGKTNESWNARKAGRVNSPAPSIPALFYVRYLR